MLFYFCFFLSMHQHPWNSLISSVPGELHHLFFHEALQLEIQGCLFDRLEFVGEPVVDKIKYD